jgi:hypothetical protein
MAALRKFISRFGIHMAGVAGGFVLVLAFVLVQDQREVMAEQGYAAARQDTIDQLNHARALGLTASEVSDLIRQDQTIAQGQAPTGAAPFNQSRISFFGRARDDELALQLLIQSRESGLLEQSRGVAREGVIRFISDLSAAEKIGVDPQPIEQLRPDAASLTRALNQASTIGDYRDISAQLKRPAGKLALLIADQETANAVAAQYAQKIAAVDHGDAGLARQTATAALATVRDDLQTASLFQIDVSVIQARVDRLQTQLAAAASVAALEQIGGSLQARGQELEQAMNSSLPEKAIVISLKDQVLRAYLHGKPIWSTYVTTGRPGLETDPGNFRVYSKQSPFTMHSPWPKGSPYWYPDTPVRTVMWFNGGAGIHDSSWRAYYGPGTEFPHYDPFGDDNGSHGCVNVPPRNMPWLWDWTPVGTPVIVY